MRDTTETRIKMCEKAEEILKGHKWEIGDHYCYPEEGGAINIVLNLDMPTNLFSQAVWLPRQDQLQEMVRDIREKSSGIRLRLVTAFYSWLKEDEEGEGDELSFAPRQLDYNSMEQLWLAFVMKEKYNKTWDGSEWTST